MDDPRPHRTRKRWPQSARATCAALAGIVVVLGITTVVVAQRSSDGATNASASRSGALRSGASGDSATRTGHVQAADVSASAMPVPAVDAEQAMVGPLFPDGLSGTHSCTATVVASSHGDTVLTAAHCLSGSARGWLFAPGYESGKTPEGVWTVSGQYVTDRWLKDQAPSNDFAVLTVANRTIDGRSATLASVAGAAQLGVTPEPGTLIRVIGYNAGRNDPATTCVVPMRLSHDHPTFYCHGFVGGSSGSPWLLVDTGAPTVVGMIGGRHQGGCTEYTSHSAVFTTAVTALVSRASDGGTPDEVPKAGSDDCPNT